MTNFGTSSHRRAVRMPFRLLAGLLCLLWMMAAASMAYVTWKDGVQALRVQEVLQVPGMLWFFRLSFYAVLRGDSPPQDYWPFATARVAGVYWVILICVLVTAKG